MVALLNRRIHTLSKNLFSIAKSNGVYYFLKLILGFAPYLRSNYKLLKLDFAAFCSATFDSYLIFGFTPAFIKHFRK